MQISGKQTGACVTGQVANPSREQAYHLYSVFAEQRHRLGCG